MQKLTIESLKSLCALLTEALVIADRLDDALLGAHLSTCLGLANERYRAANQAET